MDVPNEEGKDKDSTQVKKETVKEIKDMTLPEKVEYIGRGLIRGLDFKNEDDKKILAGVIALSKEDYMKLIKQVLPYMDPAKYYELVQEMVKESQARNLKDQSKFDEGTFMRSTNNSVAASLFLYRDEIDFNENIRLTANLDHKAVEGLAGKVPKIVFQHYKDFGLSSEAVVDNIVFNYFAPLYSKVLFPEFKLDPNKREEVLFSLHFLKGGKPDGNMYNQSIKTAKERIEPDLKQLAKLEQMCEKAGYDLDKLKKLTKKDEAKYQKLEKLVQLHDKLERAKQFYELMKVQKENIAKEYAKYQKIENKEPEIDAKREFKTMTQEDRNIKVEEFNKQLPTILQTITAKPTKEPQKVTPITTEEKKSSKEPQPVVTVSSDEKKSTKEPQPLITVPTEDKTQKKSLFEKFKATYLGGMLVAGFKLLFGKKDVVGQMGRTAVKSTGEVVAKTSSSQEKEDIKDTTQIQHVTPRDTTTPTLTTTKDKRLPFVSAGYREQFDSKQMTQRDISDVYGDLNKNVIEIQNKMRKTGYDPEDVTKDLNKAYADLQALKTHVKTSQSQNPELDGPYKENVNSLIGNLESKIKSSLQQIAVVQKSEEEKSVATKLDSTSKFAKFLVPTKPSISDKIQKTDERLNETLGKLKVNKSEGTSVTIDEEKQKQTQTPPTPNRRFQ